MHLLQGVLTRCKELLKIKFDIAYFVATQKLAFTQYPALCELEVRHGVKLGTSYVNQNAGKTFCHFIAQSRRERIYLVLAFFLFLWMERLTKLT